MSADSNKQFHAVSLKCASAGSASAFKRKESAIRRYFYDTLASYLSLDIRPEDQIVEIDPRSKGLVSDLQIIMRSERRSV